MLWVSNSLDQDQARRFFRAWSGSTLLAKAQVGKELLMWLLPSLSTKDLLSDLFYKLKIHVYL